jgi:hypothetical protein
MILDIFQKKDDVDAHSQCTIGPLLHFGMLVGLPWESRQGCRMLKMQQDWRRQTLKPSAQMQPPAEKM